MGSATRKSYRIHICCSILVVAFLIIVPIIAATSSTQEVAGAGTGIKTDPLNRLPASPEKAHQRLEESRTVGWPEAEAGDMSASSVQKGVHVSIPHDTVEGYTTHANSNVRVKLIRGATTVQTLVVKTNPNRLFTADLSTGNIKSGDQVQVTDLAGGATVRINCTLTGSMNLGANRVSGTTASGNKIDVYVRAPSTYYGDVPPGVAHKSTKGTSWSVNFRGALTLRRGDVASIFSTDGRGNKVLNVVNAGGSLVVYPQYDDVMGFYRAGRSLTVKAGSASKKVGTAGDGFFEAWFTNHNIVSGERVSCAMGSNRSITVADVTANYDIINNHILGTGPANKIIRVTMNPYGTPVVVQSSTNAQGKFDVNLAGKYTATGTDVFNVTWYDSDGDCVVYEFQTYSWHLAEGYTGGDFDTYVLVQNPGTEIANVTMTFQLETGTAAPMVMTLPAGSRTTVHLDELPGLADASVSTKVTCTNGATINAERSMYFIYYGDNLASGKSGGHDSIGTLAPSKTWYLAEGYTGGDFDTYVLVQNPSATDAKVTLNFQLPVGSSASPYSFTLKGNTRLTVHLDTSARACRHRCLHEGQLGSTGGGRACYVLQVLRERPGQREGRRQRLHRGNRSRKDLVHGGGLHRRGLRHLRAGAEPDNQDCQRHNEFPTGDGDRARPCVHPSGRRQADRPPERAAGALSRSLGIHQGHFER